MEQVKKIISERTPIDEIVCITRLSNFYEVIGRAGGDVLTYRIYDDGKICER